MRTQVPDFWDDAKAAETQMRKVKELKNWIVGYNAVKTAADELRLFFDFYKEDAVTEEEVDEAYRQSLNLIETLEMKNMLSHEEDKLGAACNLVINYPQAMLKFTAAKYYYAELAAHILNAMDKKEEATSFAKSALALLKMSTVTLNPTISTTNKKQTSLKLKTISEISIT